MYVEKQGLEAIAAGAQDATARVEQLYQSFVAARDAWDSPAKARMYTREHIEVERSRLREQYRADVLGIVAATKAARENLRKAVLERSPGAMLKAALTPAATDDVEAATLRELTAARLARDAKMAGGDELPGMVEVATAAGDLHQLAILHREVTRRDWPLTDPARVRAKIAIEKALDDIDLLVPDRAKDVQTIEAAGRAFHMVDEFAHAATFNHEPLPLQMKRSAERIAASKETA